MVRKRWILAGMLLLAIGICVTVHLAEVNARSQRTKAYMSVLSYLELDESGDESQLVHFIVKGDIDNIDYDAVDKILEKVGYDGEILNDGRHDDVTIWYSVGVVTLIIMGFGLAILYLKQIKRENTKELEEREKAWQQLHKVEVKRLNQELVRNQNYLENVAHQIRTKLTNAELNIDMAQLNASDKEVKLLEEATFHMDRIDVLLCQLLRIGRLESGEIPFQKDEIDVGAFIDTIIAKRPDRNRIIADNSRVVAAVDDDWLYEMVVSLIDNCFDNISETQQVGVITKKDENMLYICIWDNGNGFAEGDIPYLFDRFYSKSDNKQAGHFGIGLNLAKIIVDAHSGTINAVNRPEGGAAFEVRIPLYSQLKKNKVNK